MGHENSNGVTKLAERFTKVEHDIEEIKDDLTGAVKELTNAVNTLNTKFESFIVIAANSIPIKAVLWMFMTLVLSMVGVEGARWLFEVFLKAPV